MKIKRALLFAGVVVSSCAINCSAKTETKETTVEKVNEDIRGGLEQYLIKPSNLDTPLHSAVYAASHSRKQHWYHVVEQHLHEGYDINARDAKGNTPLMIAVTGNDYQLVHFLLANNANPRITNNDGLDTLSQNEMYYFTLEGKQIRVLLLRAIRDSSKSDDHKEKAEEKSLNDLIGELACVIEKSERLLDQIEKHPDMINDEKEDK
jgi:ankyrin repeat protein